MEHFCSQNNGKNIWNNGSWKKIIRQSSWINQSWSREVWVETNSSQWHEQTQDEGLCHQISGRNFLRESTQKWDKCSGKVGNNFTFSLDLVMNHLHFKTRPKLRLFVTKFLRESRQKWEKYSCKGIVTINFSLDGRITQIESSQLCCRLFWPFTSSSYSDIGSVQNFLFIVAWTTMFFL